MSVIFQPGSTSSTQKKGIDFKFQTETSPVDVMKIFYQETGTDESGRKLVWERSPVVDVGCPLGTVWDVELNECVADEQKSLITYFNVNNPAQNAPGWVGSTWTFGWKGAESVPPFTTQIEYQFLDGGKLLASGVLTAPQTSTGGLFSWQGTITDVHTVTLKVRKVGSDTWSVVRRTIPS